MLTTAQLTDVLTTITYRPGWNFSIYEDTWEGLHIRIVATLDNSYNPGTTTDVGINSPLPPMQDADSFVAWLAWRLGRIESHEMREWLKVNGETVFDPHLVS